MCVFVVLSFWFVFVHFGSPRKRHTHIVMFFSLGEGTLPSTLPWNPKSSARIPQSGWVLVFGGERYGFCIFVGLQRPDVLIGVGKVRSFAWLLGFWRLEGICSIGQFLNGEHAATCLDIDPQDVAHKRPVSYRGGCVFFWRAHLFLVVATGKP